MKQSKLNTRPKGREQAVWLENSSGPTVGLGLVFRAVESVLGYITFLLVHRHLPISTQAKPTGVGENHSANLL